MSAQSHHVPWGAGRSATARAQKTKGQFFTPAPVVAFMFQIAGAEPGWSVIDPACGDGAFLAEAAALGCWPVVGVDRDPAAIDRCRDRLGKAPMLLEQDGLVPLQAARVNVGSAEGAEVHTASVQDGQKGYEARACSCECAKALPAAGFDLVIGNPPFNALRHGVSDPAVLSRFVLGRRGRGVRARQATEVLFLERFIQLARPGGVVCIIVPDGILANTRLRYVREFVLGAAAVRAVVSLPRSTFAAASTDAKTSVLLLRKGPPAASAHASMATVESLDELDAVRKQIGADAPP